MPHPTQVPGFPGRGTAPPRADQRFDTLLPLILAVVLVACEGGRPAEPARLPVRGSGSAPCPNIVGS